MDCRTVADVSGTGTPGATTQGPEIEFSKAFR